MIILLLLARPLLEVNHLNISLIELRDRNSKENKSLSTTLETSSLLHFEIENRLRLLMIRMKILSPFQAPTEYSIV